MPWAATEDHGSQLFSMALDDLVLIIVFELTSRYQNMLYWWCNRSRRGGIRVAHFHVSHRFWVAYCGFVAHPRVSFKKAPGP